MHILKADLTHNDLLGGKCNPHMRTNLEDYYAFLFLLLLKILGFPYFIMIHGAAYLKHTLELYKTDFCNSL